MTDAPQEPSPDPEREAVTARLSQAEAAAARKHFHEAVGICRDILEAKPECAAAMAVLGAIEAHRGHLLEATRLLERAVALEPGQAAWFGNLSGIYRIMYRLDDALTVAREAVRLAPALARNHINLAKVHVDRGERDEAVASFMHALVRDTDNAEGHLGIGQILLSEGNFRPGWHEYAWRNKLDQAKGMLPRMVTPEWNGMSLPKDRILLVGDQGYGDSIQFARYIPRVARMVGEVVVGCSPELAALLRPVPGVVSVHTRWDEIPRHSAHALLSSLPGILGTDFSSIPRDIPYFRPDPALCAAWETRLGPRPTPRTRRVGLVWAGRPTHPNDSRRSLRLDALAGLLDLPDIQWVSLQKPLPPRDTERFAALGLTDVSPDLPDFAATAALLTRLDLVISIDSAVAHLAGALGKPVWIMTPTPADWRWLQDRADSPWYPSLRLFRQEKPGAWPPLIAAVREALASVAALPAPVPA